MRRIVIRPGAVSATKMSPFGAWIMLRAFSSPVAKSETWNPTGTCRAALDGRRITIGELPELGVAKGRGRSWIRIRWCCSSGSLAVATTGGCWAWPRQEKSTRAAMIKFPVRITESVWQEECAVGFRRLRVGGRRSARSEAVLESGPIACHPIEVTTENIENTAQAREARPQPKIA